MDTDRPRADIIRAHIARYLDTEEWLNIPDLPGWLAWVGDGVHLHVPVVYLDPEDPSLGYVDDYSDLPMPYDAYPDGEGECWMFTLESWGSEEDSP